MIKLCVFDLDGTTVNSLKSIAYFANETLRQFGQSPRLLDEYRHLAGGGARKLIRNLVNVSGAPEELYEPMLADWIERYEKNFLYLTEPYPGVNEMLADLKALGIHTAIVTNKHGNIADQICSTAFGTDGSLLDICVSDHPGMVLKPAPDELLHLMARFGAEPQECVYCGDHLLDMQTGINAGVITIGVTWGFHTREELLSAGANVLADHPAEIVAFVKRMNGKDL